VNPYGIASRGEPNTALDDALSALEFQTSSQSADGGGVAISVGPAIQAFTDNEVIVSFCGHLTNVDYLAWRLFSAEGRRGDTFASNQSPVEAANKLIGGRCYEAELVCHMYKAFGTKALPKLRGQFSFACFDARTVRVFAARDPSGTYPLMYGRADDGTVVVANFQSADQLLGGDGDTGDGKYSVPLDTPNNLLSVPAGCFIYGHRGIKPQRYAKDVVEAKKQQSEASDAVANALRGLKVGRRSLDGRKSLDGGSAGSVSSGTPPQQSSWSKQSGGKSRLPWRRDSLDEQRPSPSSLSPSAKPWSAGDLSKHEGVAEDSTNSTGDSSSEHGEHEPALSEEHLSSLSGLEAHDEAHDTFSESAKVSKNLEPGTKDEHSRAETVAVKAAVAALRRVASGANMKGMVRMGSSNALHALGLNPSAAAFGSDNLSSLSGRRNSGDIPGRRMSGNSDKSETSEGASNFAIHRVPSRSGLISSMVKVASFGNLGGLQHVGSLNDLRHAAKEKKKKEKDDDDETDDAWADMSLLVISNNASGGQP
tara:strand:- start:1315 stop:2925 length:1611 start_codon:yes stop_codon:yes gene_type:complete